MERYYFNLWYACSSVRNMILSLLIPSCRTYSNSVLESDNGVFGGLCSRTSHSETDFERNRFTAAGSIISLPSMVMKMSSFTIIVKSPFLLIIELLRLPLKNVFRRDSHSGIWRSFKVSPPLPNLIEDSL